MKEYNNLTKQIKALEVFHKKVIEDQLKGEPTEPFRLTVNETFDEAEDLFTFIITDQTINVRRIDPILKTSRKSKLQSWEKIAEFGAKAFAKKAKLPDEWDFLFPKKTRLSTAKKLMKHFDL